MSWLDAYFTTGQIAVFAAGVALPTANGLDVYGDGQTMVFDAATGRAKLTIPGADVLPQGANYVDAATTEPITLSGAPQTIDGYSAGVGARVLDKDNADPAARGVYVVASGAWTRAADFASPITVRSGVQVYTRNGTVNGGVTFKLEVPSFVAIDTTPLIFTSLLVNTTAATMTIGGAATIAHCNANLGEPALFEFLDPEGDSTLAFGDSVGYGSIGMLSKDDAGTDSNPRALVLSGPSGRSQSGTADNNVGWPVILHPGKPGTGGSGAPGGHGYVGISDSPLVDRPYATIGLVRAANPESWDDVAIAFMNRAGDGNIALLSLGDDDDGTIGTGATSIKLDAPTVDAGTLYLSPTGGSTDDWDRLFDASTGLATLAAGRFVALRKSADPWRADTSCPALPSFTHISAEPGGSIVSSLVAAAMAPFTYVFYADSQTPTQAAGTLAATPALGDTSLSVSLTTKPVVGHYIQLSHGVSVAFYRIETSSGGASPWTVTIDRPIVLPWTSGGGGDTVTEYTTPAPRDITIDLGGAPVTGGGNQIVQAIRSERVTVRGVHYTGTSCSVGFDDACFDSVVEDCYCDLAGTDITNGTAHYCQAGEDVLFRRCDIRNSFVIGIELLDCVTSRIEDCNADSCGIGFSVSSIGTGPDAKASFGPYDCTIAGSAAIKCGSGFAVAIVGPSYRTVIKDSSAIACTGYGVFIGAGAVDTTIAQCDVRGSAVGVFVTAGAVGVKIRDLSADGCTAGALASSGDLDVDGMRATCGIAATGLINLGGTGTSRIRSCYLKQTDSNGYGIYITAAGHAEIDGVFVDGSAAAAIYMSAAGTVNLRNFRVDGTARGGGDQGIVVTAGTVVLNGGVDLSASSAPFVIVAPGVVTGFFDIAISNIAMTTANKTATWAEYAADTLIISGTLGSGRDLVLPIYQIPQRIVNNADQTVTVKAVSGSGVAVAAGAKKSVVFDGTNYVEIP